MVVLSSSLASRPAWNDDEKCSKFKIRYNAAITLCSPGLPIRIKIYFFDREHIWNKMLINSSWRQSPLLPRIHKACFSKIRLDLLSNIIHKNKPCPIIVTYNLYGRVFAIKQLGLYMIALYIKNNTVIVIVVLKFVYYCDLWIKNIYVLS